MDEFVVTSHGKPDSNGLPTNNQIESELVACLESIRLVQTEIIENVTRFVKNTVSATFQIDLFEYSVAMILYLWKRGYNLMSILNGLHKQSIQTIHEYFCPDIVKQLMDEKKTKTTDTNIIDPYKQITEELQRLSDQKPTKCRFCGKESIFTYVSAQTRSADEGMTTFVTCSLCGKQQRM